MRRRLGKLQHLACRCITGATRGTPTAAMEVLLCLPPLHLAAECEALRTAYRFDALLGRPLALSAGVRGDSGRALMSSLPPERGGAIDTQRAEINLRRRYRCIIPPRNEWHTFGWDGFVPDATVVYTDGSLMDSCSGAGVYSVTENIELSLPLGKQTTVFQAEVFAICVAALELQNREMVDRRIYICSDSQAAINACSGMQIASKIVREAVCRLNELSRCNSVILLWVPGHIGVKGNEEADALARAGSQTPFTGPQPAIGCSSAEHKAVINGILQQKHYDHWHALQGCRQSKIFVDAPRLSRTDYLLKMGKRDLRTIVGLVTGFIPLNEYINRIGGSTSATCDMCLEDDETAAHYIMECPAFGRPRYLCFGRMTLTEDELLELDLSDILRFTKTTDRLIEIQSLWETC